MYTVDIPIPGLPDQYMASVSGFDVVELMPASLKPIRIRRIRLTQRSEASTEEEQFALTVLRGHTTSGSDGFTVTPRPLTTEIAAGFAAEVLNSTLATGGSPIVLVEDAWNTRSGLDVAFSPEESPGAVDERLVVRSSGVTDNVEFKATVWVEELG